MALGIQDIVAKDVVHRPTPPCRFGAHRPPGHPAGGGSPRLLHPSLGATMVPIIAHKTTKNTPKMPRNCPKSVMFACLGALHKKSFLGVFYGQNRSVWSRKTV